MVEPLTGKTVVVQPGAVGSAAVVKLVAFAAQPVAGPTSFLGTTYQLYWLAAVRPAALYAALVTFAVGVSGAVVSAFHRYTSYEVAVGAAAHVNIALVVVTTVAPFAGDVLDVHPGAVGSGAVVKLVVFAVQPTASPIAFLGTTYQLYKLEAVSPEAA